MNKRREKLIFCQNILKLNSMFENLLSSHASYPFVMYEMSYKSSGEVKKQNIKEKIMIQK
jgi:hypothetical protein